MKLQEADWLNAAKDILYRLAHKHFLQNTWYDFLLWASYETGQRTENGTRCQEKILSSYSEIEQDSFIYLYRLIAEVVSDNPRQNVPMKIMESAQIGGKYRYNENSARRILLGSDSAASGYRLRIHPANQKVTPRFYNTLTDYFGIQKESNSDRIDKLLTIWNLGQISLIDECCSQTGGSRLIAAANVYRDYCPFGFQDRLLLIANDCREKIYSLISFLQLALMNMACYVLVDDVYTISTECGMELMVPPTAICSLPCFSHEWNDLRRSYFEVEY